MQLNSVFHITSILIPNIWLSCTLFWKFKFTILHIHLLEVLKMPVLRIFAWILHLTCVKCYRHALNIKYSIGQTRVFNGFQTFGTDCRKMFMGSPGMEFSSEQVIWYFRLIETNNLKISKFHILLLSFDRRSSLTKDLIGYLLLCSLFS